MLTTWPGIFSRHFVPGTMAAASSEFLTSRAGVVFVLTSTFVILIYVPEWLVSGATSLLTFKDMGLPSASITIPILIPAVLASTPVANSPSS